MANAGRVAIVPKGDWDLSEAYKRLDAVTYNNILYIAKKVVPKNTAVTNTDYWMLSVAGGVAVKATTKNIGQVQPDGETIEVDADGKISAKTALDTKPTIIATAEPNIVDTVESPMLVTNATKNLFDARILNTTPASVNSNTKYSVSEGSITVSAVSKNTSFVQVYWLAPIEKLGLSVGDKVFFSIEIDTSGANINGEQRVYLYQTSNENDGSKKVILSPGKEQGKLDVIDDTDIVLLFRLNQNTDYNEVGQFFTVKNIQIEKSSAVTNYVPYDGYEIKSCGKNLVTPTYATITLNGITCTNNGDGTYTFNGTATDSIFFNINKNISINKGTKYKVVCFKDEDYIQNKIISCVRRVDTTAEFVFNNGTFVSNTENCWLWIQITKGVTVSNLVAKPMITTDLNATYDDFVPYQDGGTVQITPSTEFPLLGLKAFDGETNIISPGNVEVTYAKNNSGKAILGMCKPTVKNLVSTVEGNPLDATMGAQLKKEIDELKAKVDAMSTSTTTE